VRGTAGAGPGPAAPPGRRGPGRRRPQRPARLRRPGPRSGHPGSGPGWAGGRTDRAGVRPVPPLSGPSTAGTQPGPAARRRVGAAGGHGQQRGRRLRGLPAGQAGRAAADPDRARGRLRAAGPLMSIRTRITLVGVGIVTVVICCLSSSLFALLSRGIDADRDTALSARADAAAASLATASRSDFAPARALAPVDPRSSVDIFLNVLADDGTQLMATGDVGGTPLAVPAAV